MQNVFPDPLFLNIRKATGTYALKAGIKTISVLPWEYLKVIALHPNTFSLVSYILCCGCMAVLLSPHSHGPSSVLGCNSGKVAETRVSRKWLSTVTCSEIEGTALPAVSDSSYMLGLHVTLFTMLGSQPARLWASGSTQQRGGYIIKPVSHRYKSTRHCLSFCTLQQAVGDNSVILASFLQFLSHFGG